MSLSLALGTSSCSAHAGRGGGIIFSGSTSQRLLRGSHWRRYDAACGRLGVRSSVRKGEGEGAKASICRVSIPAAAGAAAATFLRPGWCSQDIINKKEKARRDHVVCSATRLDYETLQWISSISCLVLMLVKGTAIHRSFLAPLFALQAPTSVISWIRGEYGIWTAFLALLVRLFYFIPGELELPFLTMLLVIVGPRQAMNLRETKTGAIISLVIAGYLLFQHFSRGGSLQKAFDQGSVVATLAIICIVAVPCVLLF
ncbi:hypothetical protein Taro_052355 [Colocasia esculenta]|uniref:Uncharacterized protein n=1 Tax=Colocasia esculenta TaxID=4460 RepID=A0A843XJE4_COLES|nr:hypothetical protein [Colocasia esculenta]